MNKLEFPIKNWSKRKIINGKSFDDIFQIEGVPLWWFYKRFFVSHVMPKPINSFCLVYNRKKPSIRDKIKFFFGSKLLKAYVSFNERRKINFLKKEGGASSKEDKVLFLTYTNHLLKDGKIARIQKVIEEVNKDKKIKGFVLFADPLSSKSYKRLSDCTSVYSYYDCNLAKRAKAVASDLHKKWACIDEKTKRRMFKTADLPVWDCLKYAFDFFFSKEFLYILILHYELLKKIIKEENIRSIVLTSKNGMVDKCILAAAKQLKVPSVLIQHGLGEGGVNPDLVYNTKIAAFGKFTAKKLVKSGVKRGDIVITGPLVFDEIVNYAKKASGAKKKIILLTTQTLIESNNITKKEYFNYLKNIIQDINKAGNIQIIIKLHPRERHIADYRRMVDSCGFKNVFVTQKGGQNYLYELISKCDVMVNLYGSTTILEASILDKPTVTINLPNLKRSPPLGKLDPSLKADYGKNIERPIKLLLDKPLLLQQKRKRLVKEFCYKVDGRASERIVKLIKDSIEK